MLAKREKKVLVSGRVNKADLEKLKSHGINISWLIAEAISKAAKRVG